MKNIIFYELVIIEMINILLSIFFRTKLIVIIGGILLATPFAYAINIALITKTIDTLQDGYVFYSKQPTRFIIYLLIEIFGYIMGNLMPWAIYLNKLLNPLIL